MSLFDETVQRVDAPYSHQTETIFGYLNRSNRTEAERIRKLINDWLSHYPETHLASIVSRLRKPNDEGFLAAFWELALHEWLLRTGNVVLEIEPTIPGLETKPDYLVQSADGAQFYLEAVASTGESDAERAAEKRLNDVLHAIDQVNVTRHVLSVHPRGTPNQPVALSRLKRALQAWCDALPEGEDASKILPFRYEQHGLCVVITAFPKRGAIDDVATRASATWLRSGSRTLGEDVLKSLRKKASKYGNLPAPYVIAVNWLGEFAGFDDVIAALFGAPVAAISLDSDASVELRRSGDGLWGNVDQPRATQVSAVLATEALSPWNLGQRSAYLIHNPRAERPLPQIGSRLVEGHVDDNEDLVRSIGEPWHQIFDLHPFWPEDKGFDPFEGNS